MILELIGSKARKISSCDPSVLGCHLIFIDPKIVLKLLFEDPLRIWVRNFGLIAICLIHLPGRLQTCPVFFLENIIGIQNKVVEVVGCAEHRDRNIVVIRRRVCQIYIPTMSSNSTELKFNLLYCEFIFLLTQLFATRRDIDESSEQTRFTVGDPNGSVRAEK